MPKPSLPSKKVKDKVIQLRVSTEDIKTISELQKKYNVSASKLLRKGLENLGKTKRNVTK
jgi:ribosomal protein L28